MVGECHFQAFWVSSKPVKSNFLHIFRVRKKIKKNSGKIGFYRKKSVFIGKKIGFYRKNRRFFADFFFPIFPSQYLFQHHRNPKSAIFLSMFLNQHPLNFGIRMLGIKTIRYFFLSQTSIISYKYIFKYG